MDESLALAEIFEYSLLYFVCLLWPNQVFPVVDGDQVVVVWWVLHTGIVGPYNEDHIIWITLLTKFPARMYHQISIVADSILDFESVAMMNE